MDRTPEHDRIATIWLKWEGKRATVDQVTRRVRQFPGEEGLQLMRGVCADRGLILVQDWARTEMRRERKKNE